MSPGAGAQRPLHRVAQGEEEQHDEHPGQLPGDHGYGVVGLVHELLATGDGGGVVCLRAAYLVPAADVLATYQDGRSDCAHKEAQSDRREGSAPRGGHLL